MVFVAVLQMAKWDGLTSHTISSSLNTSVGQITGKGKREFKLVSTVTGLLT